MSAIHPTAVVETASIGRESSIGEFAVLRAGAVLGESVRIHPHVVIEAGVELGDGVEVLPGAYLGRAPRATRGIAREPTFARRLTIGASSSVGAGAVVYYDVEVGAENLIGDGAVIRELSRIGEASVIGTGVTLDRAVTVGDGVKLMHRAHLTGHMRVEDRAFIGPHVSTMNDDAMGRADYDSDRLRGPVVEEGAIVGGGASLLPGVVVGRSAVVGSGAVVTRDVEPGSTVMGVPARPR